MRPPVLVPHQFHRTVQALCGEGEELFEVGAAGEG